MMKDLKGYKILVVEDNFMSYKLMDVHFQRVGLEMIYASDGYAALEMFDEVDDLDLILMDIQLPGISGLEVTHQIRHKNAQIPIIAATANVFAEDQEACIAAGCNDYVKKPIDFDYLFHLLSKYLD